MDGSPESPATRRLKGDWWSLYQSPQLDALEVQVDAANQTLKAAEANFHAARAAIGYARSNDAPTIGVNPYVGSLRESGNSPYFLSSLANNGGATSSFPST